ncbi:MAG: cyclic nucleotide-binding and patatin-like phospholipase domain-containing protein [Thermodesulfobacteriota bacterium]|nr:cyclic nucleotide-binding and patatin-like phospholipase domain-containing protein [Thermodesulfobacteriota bacterium]
MVKSTTIADNELIAFLGKIPLFSSIPKDQLPEIAKEFEPAFFQKGETILKEGDPGDSMYIIKSGSVSVHAKNNGAEVFITSLHRGDFFGELALLTGSPRMATIRVILDVHLYRLKERGFEKFLKNNPIIGLYLSRHYARRFVETSQHTLNDPLPAFFAMMATHHGLRKSHFLYSLAYHLIKEAKKKTLVIELDESVSEKFPNYGLEQAQSPYPDLTNFFSDPYADILKKSWFSHSCGFMVFLLTRVKEKQYWDQLETNLPHLMDLLRKRFHLIFFSIPPQLGAIGERVLRLCDRTLVLINNTNEALPEVRGKITDIVNISGGRADHIKVGVSHLIGDRGIPRDTLGVELGIPETPAIWVHKTAPALADKIDIKKRFPVRGPRALARELGRVRVGLVLGAGSARGWAHLGVLRVLEEEGIHIDMIAGSSIGALVASIYARTASIEFTNRIVIETIPTKFQVQRKVFDYTIPVHGIIRGRKILQMVRNAVQDADFLDLLIPAYFVAVDYNTGEEVLLEKGNVSEAVRASISLPGILNPASHNGRWLLDGGLLNPVPVDVLIQKGADIIIAVCIEGGKDQRGQGNGKPPGIMSVLSRTMNIIHSQATRDFAQKADIVLYPEVNEFAWDAFHRAQDLARAGEEKCRRHIEEIKHIIAEKRK